MSRRAAAIAGAALLLSVGGAAYSAGLIAPANTSPPTISGTAVLGSTLTASSGSWSGSTPMSFTYRWQRCSKNGDKCKNAGGKSQTYKLSRDDVGHRIRVSVTAVNSDGSSAAVSAASDVVTDGSPVNAVRPTVSGTLKQGETLTAASGTWTGPGPISFTFQWRRCNTSGDNCRDTSTGQTTQLGADDVGHTIRVEVRARNSFGGTSATSAATGVVAPKGPLPASASPPTIAGIAREGQVLTAAPGSWANGVTAFAYKWRRCDANGNNCDGFADGRQVRLAAADVGHRIRVVVRAANQYGTTEATSAPTAVVAAAVTTPSGAIKLSSGETSLPVSLITSPQRLVISGVRFVPARLVGRQAFIGRFRVTDTRGYVVRGALVYAVGLPYSWVRVAPEAATSTDGWVQITFFPTRFMPVRRAALVFFLRARKPGDSLLAGVSTRRLVQVKIG